jgi:23S rRNA (cytosine1962-C5)-methyltransferase
MKYHVVKNQGRDAAENPWKNTTVILRNDVSVRKLEGLELQEPRILKEGKETNLKATSILVRSVSGIEPIPFLVNLIDGQKTGFFLDQFGNIELAAALLRSWPNPAAPLRILDLCCYVGQWGVQLGKLFKDQKISVEVTAVDASATALDFAKKNLAQQGISCETIKADVLKGLSTLADQSFDLVISDPPALIKGRKDIPTGSHAYLQLATQALRLTRPGGAIVACSCSFLMEEEAFTSILQKAAQRNQRGVKWVGRGAQSSDHPMLCEFPEGRYLKGWIGILS